MTKPSDYHGIALWDAQLHRKKMMTQREQAYAAQTDAPADAIYADPDGGWVCVSDLGDDHPFRADYAAYLEKQMPTPFHYIRRLHELEPNTYEDPSYDLVIIDAKQRHCVSPNTWDRAKEAEDEFIQQERAGFADVPNWGTITMPAGRLQQPKRPDPVPVSKLSTLRMAAGNERLYSRVILQGAVMFWVGIGWVNEGPAQEKDFEVYPVVID